MKKIQLTLIVMSMCVLCYAQDRPTGEKKVAKFKAGKALADTVKKTSPGDEDSEGDGLVYGVIQYKSVKSTEKKAPASQEILVLIMRDISTNQIIDVTTTDADGRFMFKKMKYLKQGVEIEVDKPSLRWPWKKKKKCRMNFRQLEPAVFELEFMEECDPGIDWSLMLGYCICVTDPCPCENPLDKLYEKMGSY